MPRIAFASLLGYPGNLICVMRDARQGAGVATAHQLDGQAAKPALRRTLKLPWLVLYGVGVTVGAGIFALIGEILRLAGDAAAMAFVIAGSGAPLATLFEAVTGLVGK